MKVKTFLKSIIRGGLSLRTNQRFAVRGHYKVTGYRRDGSVKFVDEIDNLVTNVGLNLILDVAIGAVAKPAAYYVGVKNAGAVAAGDTMSSHAGWTENQNYSEANRPTYSPGSAASQAISNTSSLATFTFNTNGQTIAGVFLATNNTKGGTTGTLVSVGDFASSKNMDDGEILTVELTYTLASV